MYKVTVYYEHLPNWAHSFKCLNEEKQIKVTIKKHLNNPLVSKISWRKLDEK